MFAVRHCVYICIYEVCTDCLLLYSDAWKWCKNRNQSTISSCLHHSVSSINTILCSLLLLVSPMCCKHCSLYEPPAPGIVCLHGNELTRMLTNSSTSWMVEFYSSWCGHCQYFAPTMKEIGDQTQQWSSVVRIGVMDCSEGRENQEECSKFGIQGFPTLKVSTVFSFLLLCVCM